MCGRFAFYSSSLSVARRLRLPAPAETLAPRYNITPGTWVTAARRAVPNKEPGLDALWWGYRPKWAGSQAPQPINATIEKVATSGFFKAAFARHRCLIPADGWYEWLKLGDRKQPHFLCREDREAIWLAGIWTERNDGAPGCAIITEPARGRAQQIHSRMPFILDDESLDLWLDADFTDPDAIRGAMHHLDERRITHWPVSRAVNRPGNDSDASLINPA